MWREIARLTRAEGLTILLTTHYLDEADRLASRLAIMDRGRVVAEGTPEGLKSELRGDAIHLELPEAVARQRAGAVVARLRGLREVSLDGAVLRARADDGPGAVPGVIGALEGAGVRVASVTIARPSLDDVYLRYAGRGFAAGEGELAA